MSFTMYQHPRTLTLPRRVSMTTYSIPPTVIYVKQHPVTGLKYVGKTTRDPFKYKGSGTDWKLHLKEYGSEHIITTIVFGPCEDSEVISKWAIEFSIKNNIVESKDYANRKAENGLDGAPKGNSGPNKGKLGKTRSVESKQLMSTSQKTTPNHSTRGKKRPEHALQMSGKNNPMYGTISPFRGKKHKIVQCPHCLKTGGEPQMIQWHFDKCKLKP